MLKENKIRELGFKLVVMWENDWKKINCTKNDKILPREEIAGMVWEIVKKEVE